MGTTRVSPIALKDEAVLICCTCGCHQVRFGCCSNEDQKDVYFLNDAK